MNGAYSILLVDDEALLRQALQIIVGSDPRITQVDEAGSGDEAIQLLTESCYDLIVLDFEMPGKDGLLTASHILKYRPGQPILLLTRYARPGLLRQALSMGIKGFLTKAAAPANVISAIIDILEKGRYIDPAIAQEAVTNDCPLTARELDVLRLTGQGFSSRSIAQRLFLSTGTVRNYISSALAKTGTTRKEEAVQIARRQNWI
jgi:two-component system response regulator DesR